MREGKFKNKSLKFYFHETYFIVALGFVLTGYYLNLIVFTLLVVVHELGHFWCARLLGIKVCQVVIYPYGGKTVLEDYLNRDIHQELLVASSGVIMQFFFYLIVCFVFHQGFIREYTMDLFTLYNGQIIFFNLFPIYPLDGGKILNLVLCRFFPYRKANTLTVILSFLTIIGIVGVHIYQYNYSNLMVFGVLFYYLYSFYQKRGYFYHRFLLERYLYKIDFPKVKVISNIKKMYRNRVHVIQKGNTYMKEKDLLRDYFTRRQ